MSRHLRVLREAGLVVDAADGRERSTGSTSGRWPRSTPGWRRSATGWGARLDALATEVHRTRRDRRAAGGQADPDAEERTA